MFSGLIERQHWPDVGRIVWQKKVSWPKLT